MFLSLAAVALSTAAAPLSGAASDDHRARWYDLRPIVAAAAPAPPGIDLSLHLSSARIDSMEPEYLDDVDLAADLSLSVDSIVRVIRLAVESDASAEATSVDRHGWLLRLVGNEAAHSLADGVLGSVMDVASDAVDVEVFRIDESAAPIEDGAVLDRRTVDALLERQSPSLTARSSIRVGRSTRLGATQSVPFVYDYDVEVAQGALGLDPIVSTIRTGLEAGVRVDRSADGAAFAVHAWGRDGSLVGAMRTVELEAFGGSPVDLPRASTSVWAASGMLEPGGAILVDAAGEGALLLRVAPTGAEPAPAAALPLGASALKRMRPEIPWLPRAEPSGGFPRRTTYETGRLEALGSSDRYKRPDPLREGLLESLGLPGVLPYGSSLIVFDAVNGAEELRAAARAWTESLAPETASIEVRYDILDSEGTRAALDDLAAFAERAPQRVASSSLVGGATLLVGGIESTYLLDYDSVIAAGTHVSDPRIGITFDGIALWCAPLARSGDARSVWFDVQAHAGEPETRTVDLANYVASPADGGLDLPRATGIFERTLSVELPVTHRAAARTLVRAPEAEWTLVAAQPLAGTEKSVVLVARVITR